MGAKCALFWACTSLIPVSLIGAFILVNVTGNFLYIWLSLLIFPLIFVASKIQE